MPENEKISQLLLQKIIQKTISIGYVGLICFINGGVLYSVFISENNEERACSLGMFLVSIVCSINSLNAIAYYNQHLQEIPMCKLAQNSERKVLELSEKMAIPELLAGKTAGSEFAQLFLSQLVLFSHALLLHFSTIIVLYNKNIILETDVRTINFSVLTPLILLLSAVIYLESKHRIKNTYKH